MNTKIWLRMIGAIIAGEIALILLTTFAQEVLFNGINYNTSTWAAIIFGGLATFLAAVGAGWIARQVAKADRKIVPIVISLIICTEMVYLITQKIVTGPLWFEVSAALSLVVGIWIGFYAYWKQWRLSTV